MNSTRQQVRHPIQVVATRTGLNPDVIRAWERRYKAVRPTRSGSRRRLYSDDDVHRLSLLRQATLAGRRIGDVAHLPLERLAELVRDDAKTPAASPAPDPASGAGRYLGRCLDAATRLDAQELEIQLNRAAMELDVGSLLGRVISPLMTRIGDSWLAGTLSIAHEHMATALVRALLESMRAAFSDPTSPCHLIATTPSGEHHELGALTAAVLAAMEGWRATYLGTDLPAREIATAALDLDASVVALSLVYPERDSRIESELRILGAELPRRTTLIVGGEAVSHYRDVLAAIGASVHEDMASYRAELRRLVV